MKSYILIVHFLLCLTLISCDRNDADDMPEGRYGYESAVSITIRIDSTQQRLDSDANPSQLQLGHGALSPIPELLHIKEIELLPDSTEHYGTQINQEEIDLIGNSININTHFRHSSGLHTFRYLRLYLTLQKFSVQCKINGNFEPAYAVTFLKYYNSPDIPVYLNNHALDVDSANQGGWFMIFNQQGTDTIFEGQTNYVTQPNSLHFSWPSPANLVYAITCPIQPPITFIDAEDHSMTISISSNKAFEWVDHSDPSYFEPLNGDTIYDFGLRGAMVTW